MLGVDDDDSDSFDNPVVVPVVKPEIVQPKIIQHRIKIPRKEIYLSFKFRTRPFGITWNFSEKGELVVASTAEASAAEDFEIPSGCILRTINGQPLESPDRLQQQLSTSVLPTTLTFLQYGRRVLNYHSPQPKLQADWFQAPRVTNVIAVAETGFKFDLRKIADELPNAIFDPSNKTVAVFMKLRNPPCNAIIFRTGNFNITGCRSEISALIAARKVARRLQRLYPKIVSLRSFQIKSVTGICDIGSEVFLQRLHEAEEMNSSYDKDQSPNCIFYFASDDKPKAGTCDVTARGKLNFLGIQSISEFWRLTEEMYKKVYPFSRNGIRDQVKEEPLDLPEPPRKKRFVAPARVERAVGLPSLLPAQPVKMEVKHESRERKTQEFGGFPNTFPPKLE